MRYAAKPEPGFFLETLTGGVKELAHNSVKKLLHCRTVGLCTAHNSLLGYRVVRSTRPVVWLPTSFVTPREKRTPRAPAHLAKNPDYPDPRHYLSATQQYFFRNAAQRHLRIEQFNRYFHTCRDSDRSETLEDAAGDEDDNVDAETSHRHHDPWAESVAPGATLPSAQCGVESTRRRKQARLAVSRAPFIEPIGRAREEYFEAKIILGLAWYCAGPPLSLESDLMWRFSWSPPENLGGAQLVPLELRVHLGAAISYEATCAAIENEFCRHEHDLICACCQLGEDAICPSCQFAVGFHRCAHSETLKWRKGTLFGTGEVDIQRLFYHLHLKRLPIDVLREKAPYTHIDSSGGGGGMRWY